MAAAMMASSSADATNVIQGGSGSVGGSAGVWPGHGGMAHSAPATQRRVTAKITM